MSQQLVPPAVHQALEAIEGLRRGKSEAKESSPVKPVPLANVDAIQSSVSRQVWAMIQLQLATAARPGEIVIMRPIDINMAGNVWSYTPSTHKTEHYGHSRTIFIGPRGQEIIRPFLSGRAVDAFLFSPAEAYAERREKLHAERKTPAGYGNSPGTNRKHRPRKTPGEFYDVSSYRRAIATACHKSGVPHWHPHQLRHNAATRLRREFGIEAARVILGHRSAGITEIYAEQDQEKGRKIMGEGG